MLCLLSSFFYQKKVVPKINFIHSIRFEGLPMFNPETFCYKCKPKTHSDEESAAVCLARPNKCGSLLRQNTFYFSTSSKMSEAFGSWQVFLQNHLFFSSTVRFESWMSVLQKQETVNTLKGQTVQTLLAVSASGQNADVRSFDRRVMNF